ncbi:hypothetical protein K523DRAFT_420809 [Schizophyllum commune Tattone D]|nr:hypothetical protein K523DRAFT_420809 [Schizophyllum commune Tattone D]
MAKKPLFHSVVYYISPSLRSPRRKQLQAALDAHGARASTIISDATHIITDTTRFDGWKEANEGAEIVTDRWVDRSVVLDRAEPPEMYSADPTMLFSGVTATCTDLLPADEIVIKTAITNLGGQWSSALTQNVTHLFALGPGTGSDKYALAMHNKRDTGMIVLLPHWFDDVIRLGTGKLDTKPYEWPEPAVLAGGGKPSGKLDKEKQQLLASATSETVPKSRAGDVWAGKKLHLAEDLELGERREAVVGAIERAGGQVVDKWTDADAYVCRYRSGKTFFQVARARKTIGTLDWVFFVLGTGQLTAPGDRLIHYPVPRRPIEEMAGKIFSITNYTGEARDYLKKLIVGMGASFNPTMRQGDSPILIAASTESEKAKKGAEWQIPVVNHLWVEDCYMTWRMLPVTTKYITFPPASDLSGLLCERGMGAYIENEENLRIEEELDRKFLAEQERQQLTQGSAMDANEVSAMVNVEEDAEDDLVEQENTPPGKDKRPSSKGERASSKVEPSSETVSRKTSGATGSPSKVTSPRKAPASATKAPASPSKAPASPTKPTSSRKAPVPPVKPASPIKPAPLSRQGKPPSSKRARPTTPTPRPSTPPPSVPPADTPSDASMSPLASPPKRRRSGRQVIEDDDDEEEAPEPLPVVVSDEDEDEVPVPAPKKGKGRTVEDEDEPKKKGKKAAEDTTPANTKKTRPVDVTPVDAKKRTVSAKSTPAEPNTSAPPFGSGKKGDATTRIKKPKPKVVELSDVESDDAPVVIQKKKKAKEAPEKEKPSRKTGRKSVAMLEDSEDDDEVVNPAPAPMDMDDDDEIAPAADSDIEFPELPTQGMPPPPPRVEKKETRTKPQKPSFVDDEAGADEEGEKEEDAEEEEGVVHISRSHRRSSTSKVVLSGKKGSSSSKVASSSKQTSSKKANGSSTKKKAQTRQESPETISPPPSPRPKKRKSTGEGAKVKETEKPKKGKAKAKAASPEDEEEEEEPEEDSLPPRKKAKTERRASTTKTKPPPRGSTSDVEDADGDVSMADTSMSRGNSRRAAATKAERRLHDTVMPDLVKYEAEKRRKSGVSAYEESPAPEKSKPKGKEKRKPKEDDAMEVDEDEGEAEEAEKPVKKGKKGKRAAHDEEDSEVQEVTPPPAKKAKATKATDKTSSSEIRMMTTGISLPDNVVHALNKLGVKVVTKPHECTHLVVARIVRTSKFLCALPHVSHLVSEEWARQSAAQKKLLPESDFPVVDKEGEKKQRIKLTEVVERARALKGKLFAGHTFFITHKTTMDRDLLRSIITANGGQLSSTNAPTVRTFKNDPKTKHLISSKEDAPVWRPIASEGFKVYTGEVVLDSALRQEVDWDNESYVLPEAKS